MGIVSVLGMGTIRFIWRRIDMFIRKAALEDTAGIAKVHVDSWRTT